jgi:hypothetical protein
MTEANPALNAHQHPESDDNAWTDPFTGLVEDQPSDDDDFSLTEMFQDLADEAPEIPEELSKPPEIMRINALDQVQLASVEAVTASESQESQETLARVVPTVLASSAVSTSATSTPPISTPPASAPPEISVPRPVLKAKIDRAKAENILPKAAEILPESAPAPAAISNVPVNVPVADLMPQVAVDPMPPVAAIEKLKEAQNSESEPPNLADLISLIQELNQCNSVLLDRVSQLEDALEQSQHSLKSSEVPRYSPQQTIPEGWSISQAQITTLTNQLEFAHQTNQRQRILNETLTAQWETSQERVAQLEREAAMLQQRYNEQSQSLAHAEITSHELQSRLYRQQRYTLQFKVALEKCLEVPPPQYEGSMAQDMMASLTDTTDATDYGFASGLASPAAEIKPWSADKSATLNLPGVKSNVLPSRSSRTVESSPVENLQLSDVELPAFLRAIAKNNADAIADDATQITASGAEDRSEGLAIASDHSDHSDHPDNTYPDNTYPDNTAQPNNSLLPKALDNAVQPLADLLAQALMKHGFHSNGSEFVKAEPTQPEVVPEVVNVLSDSEPAPSQGTNQPDQAHQADSSVSYDNDIPWDELAHLVDVSNQDAVRASLSGDFSAFESINFDALDVADESVSEVPPAVNTSPQEEPVRQVAAPQEEPIASPIEPRRRSLAMIDLPTFPRINAAKSAAT